ncbi:molybdate ABC transporter substrate-binding protein [Actinotalea sp. K2]|uniref:molybdate ABC transporter substrate-binding protein n=1 Tax=Actinotalea sp. K2 TaxID=2939438 RepID=UPI0020181210|nr:molybdate ABC transporter substrate-binding protein [Actinotalea sp. K2]MCL3861818.1 molybdate ABC transporter substrate-binding protein [Actinotalea sp. K2]
MTGALRRTVCSLVALALAASATACGAPTGAVQGSQDGPLLVAAAADLGPAFTELGALYREQTGHEVTFTFGSSGQLAQQLVNGAPFEVFASADVAYVHDVLDAGVGDPSTVTTYAVGRLVVWVREDTAEGPVAIGDLVDPRYGRIAVANPDHAPYGVAAVEALRRAGIYAQVQDRLVFGENASDTLRLASSGNADAALVALSLALAGPASHVAAVPADLHEPLDQALVVTAGGERVRPAAEFAALVASPQGRELMARHGFELPTDLPAGTG